MCTSLPRWLLAFLLLLSAGATSGLAQIPLLLERVPLYNQADRAWGNDRLGYSPTVTLRQQGCAVACYAMVVSYYSRLPLNPGTANRVLQQYRGFTQLTQLNWAIAARLYGLRFSSRVFRTDAEAVKELSNCLGRRIPVIVEVRRAGKQHFVTVVGVKGNDFIVADPDGGKLVRLFATYGRPLGTRTLVP